MNILFVCKYNAFRSRVAEEYFNKINRNKKITTISRGFIMGGNSDLQQRKLSKEILGINIAKRKPMSLTLQNLLDADLIVVVANDVPKIMFNYSIVNLRKKVVIWKIKDEQKRNRRNIKKIILAIKKKVEDFGVLLKKEPTLVEKRRIRRK